MEKEINVCKKRYEIFKEHKDEQKEIMKVIKNILEIMTSAFISKLDHHDLNCKYCKKSGGSE